MIMSKIEFQSRGVHFEFSANSRTLVCGDEHISYPVQWKKSQGRLYIVLSTECNLKCPYCFQNDFVRRNCNIDEQRIIDYICALQNQINEIVLFGGEPFLESNYNQIKSILDRFDYLKFIVFTNGNFNSSYCDMLKEYSYCFRSVIITLDGPKRIHNKRRVNPNHDSYDVILSNLLALSEHNITVNVQINVDKTNAEYIDELFEDLCSYEPLCKYQYTLNPVKYVANAIESVQLIKLFFLLKRKYALNIAVNLHPSYFLYADSTA